MSITDELRRGGTHLSASNRRAFGEEELVSIADRIDAEHESACAEAYGNGVMSVPIALDESAYIKLPVDADGVPIRVGDRLTDGEYTFTVCELATFRDGSWSIRNEDGNAWAACDVTHHALTVEDVLDEFFGKANLPDGTQTRAEIVAEYAKRLRLAEEVGE